MRRTQRTIKIRIVDAYKLVNLDVARLKKILRALCRRFDIKKANISIAIVDDKEIRKVNRRFLGRSSVTDVISFDLSDAQSGEMVFELAADAQEARRQAKKRRHSAEADLALYILHGFLHNVGFDDAKRRDAALMHQTEDEILEEFGYGKTYSKRQKVKGKKSRGKSCGTTYVA
jgi:probable rRNA maturation factor